MTLVGLHLLWSWPRLANEMPARWPTRGVGESGKYLQMEGGGIRAPEPRGPGSRSSGGFHGVCPVSRRVRPGRDKVGARFATGLGFGGGAQGAGQGSIPKRSLIRVKMPSPRRPNRHAS
jgi:hypothetical protein